MAALTLNAIITIINIVAVALTQNVVLIKILSHIIAIITAATIIPIIIVIITHNTLIHISKGFINIHLLSYSTNKTISVLIFLRK